MVFILGEVDMGIRHPMVQGPNLGGAWFELSYTEVNPKPGTLKRDPEIAR